MFKAASGLQSSNRVTGILMLELKGSVAVWRRDWDGVWDVDRTGCQSVYGL